METIFTKTENSKTNKPHRFRLTLADEFNLKDSHKNMALANLSIYYTWKNIQSVYAVTWNHKLDLPYSFQTFKIILNTLLKNMKL